MGKAAWSKKLLKKKRFNPQDQLHYFIPEEVIAFTEMVLREYGNKMPANEGIVYWAGTQEQNEIQVSMAIAPAAVTDIGIVRVSHFSNLQLVLALSEYKQIHLGQVHSHPSDWVDHSGIDDSDAAFKIEGLLSIVVPNYGSQGMRNFKKCGMHRFQKTNFIRLSERYVSTHFHMTKTISSIIIDQRDEY